MDKLLDSFQTSLRLIVLSSVAVLLFVAAKSLTPNTAFDRLQMLNQFEAWLPKLERDRDSDIEKALRDSGVANDILQSAVAYHLDVHDVRFTTDTWIGMFTNFPVTNRNNEALSMHFDPDSPQTTIDTYNTLLAAADGFGDIDTYTFDAHAIAELVGNFVKRKQATLLSKVQIIGLTSSLLALTPTRPLVCSITLSGKAETHEVSYEQSLPCVVGRTYRWQSLAQDGAMSPLLHAANTFHKGQFFQALDMPLWYLFYDLRGLTAKEARTSLQTAVEKAEERDYGVVEIEGLRITDQLMVFVGPSLLLALQLVALAQLLHIRERRYEGAKAIQDSSFFGFFHNPVGIWLNATTLALLPCLSSGILSWRVASPMNVARYIDYGVTIGLLGLGILIFVIGAGIDKEARPRSSDGSTG